MLKMSGQVMHGKQKYRFTNDVENI